MRVAVVFAIGLGVHLSGCGRVRYASRVGDASLDVVGDSQSLDSSAGRGGADVMPEAFVPFDVAEDRKLDAMAPQLDAVADVERGEASTRDGATEATIDATVDSMPGDANMSRGASVDAPQDSAVPNDYVDASTPVCMDPVLREEVSDDALTNAIQAAVGGAKQLRGSVRLFVFSQCGATDVYTQADVMFEALADDTLRGFCASTSDDDPAPTTMPVGFPFSDTLVESALRAWGGSDPIFEECVVMTEPCAGCSAYLYLTIAAFPDGRLAVLEGRFAQI